MEFSSESWKVHAIFHPAGLSLQRHTLDDVTHKLNNNLCSPSCWRGYSTLYTKTVVQIHQISTCWDNKGLSTVCASRILGSSSVVSLTVRLTWDIDLGFRVGFLICFRVYDKPETFRKRKRRLTWDMLGGCPRAGGQPLQQAAFPVKVRGVHVEVALRGPVGEQLLLSCARDCGLPRHHPLLQHVLACADMPTTVVFLRAWLIFGLGLPQTLSIKPKKCESCNKQSQAEVVEYRNPASQGMLAGSLQNFKSSMISITNGRCEQSWALTSFEVPQADHLIMTVMSLLSDKATTKMREDSPETNITGCETSHMHAPTCHSHMSGFALRG